MDPCATSLLDGIIDYAGLFPPAKLPMDEAFRRFLDHRSSADGWMLARFVCPAARLDELEPLLESTDPSSLPTTLSLRNLRGRASRKMVRVGRVRVAMTTIEP